MQTPKWDVPSLTHVYFVFTAASMVMKSSVEEEEGGWGLGIPETMRNNANWVDVTKEFKGACKGVCMYFMFMAYYERIIIG